MAQDTCNGRGQRFCNAHQIFVPYCTGDVHSGQVVEPTEAQWGNYFSGHLNFKNILQHIFDTMPAASQMEHVMFAGNSAGGYGVFTNCDYLQDYLSQQGTSAVVKCVANAGWFQPGFTEDHTDPDATPSDWPSWSAGKSSPVVPSKVLDIWQFYLPSNCVKARGNKESWKCASVHVAYPYIKAPVFLVENQFDTAQITEQVLHLPVSKVTTSQGRDFIAYFGRAMRNSTNLIVNHPLGKKGDGLFHPSCFDHGGFGKLSGYNYYEATNDWFFGRGQIPSVLVDDCDMPSPGLPCNPTCKLVPTPAPSPTPSPSPSGGCEGALRSLCSEEMTGKRACLKCAQQHRDELGAHGCTPDQVNEICPRAFFV